MNAKTAAAIVALSGMIGGFSALRTPKGETNVETQKVERETPSLSSLNAPRPSSSSGLGTVLGTVFGTTLTLGSGILLKIRHDEKNRF